MTLTTDLGKSRQRRILIVRTGAMGDIVHAMPAVAALREAHPDWFIGWVIGLRWRALLQAKDCHVRGAGMPLVDRVYSARTHEWKKQVSTATFNDIASLTRQMREGSFDLCVDMQGSIRSALIGRLAGAERFVGLQDIREKPARWLYYETVKTKAQHEVERRCEMLSKAIGEQLLPGKVQFPIDECEEERCDKLLEDLGVANNFV